DEAIERVEHRVVRVYRGRRAVQLHEVERVDAEVATAAIGPIPELLVHIVARDLFFAAPHLGGDRQLDTPVVVEVYSASESVELLLNGVSVGTAAAGSDHRYMATFTVPFAAGELVAVSSVNGVETGREVLRSAS